MLHPSTLSIPIDRDSEEPIYRQLIRCIRAQIESGSLPAGSRLPASRDLARQLNISRISVVNAYAELRAEGFLSAHAGRGTFVSGARDGAIELEEDSPRPLYSGGYEAAPSSPRPVAPAANGENGRELKHETQGTYDRSLRDLMRMARKAGIINFGHGAPPTEFFPVQHLKDALNYVLEHDGASALSYEVPEGYAPLRAAVRDYVSALGIRCSPENVLITGGTQQALDLVVQSVLSEGDILVTENPTYVGILDIARTRRVQIHGIPIDEQGMRLDLL